MKKFAMGFGTQETEVTEIGDYLGKWASVQTPFKNYIGKVVRVNGSHIELLPYKKIDYIEGGLPVHKIKSSGKPFPINKGTIVDFEGSSLKSAKNLCVYLNRKEKLETLEVAKKLSNLEKEFNPNLIIRI